jgi:hypothetical protein
MSVSVNWCGSRCESQSIARLKDANVKLELIKTLANFVI